MPVKFKDVKVGQTLMKSGSFPGGKVVAIHIYNRTGYHEGELHRLDLDNGDQWYGWAERFVKVVVDI